MQISARVHYSCLAMIDLAQHRDDTDPVAAAEISQRCGIPGPFLNQILRSLRTAGWVDSTRGSNGGYRLAVDPGAITLLEIVDAMGGQDNVTKLDSHPSPADELLQQTWELAATRARATLSKWTLAELASRAQQNDPAMFYI